MIELDEQQQHAVQTNSERALVIAGAGSGKTRVLTERIAFLIEHRKVSPHEIMAFSFTRKASGEIRSRLETRLGAQARNVTMGTMHGIALGMIHRFGEQIGLKPRNVTVYSQWESDYLLKEIAIEMGIFKKAWNPKKGDIDKLFADYYERGKYPDEDGGRAADLFYTFIARCRENNALTYGALLVALELLIPTMSKYLNTRHILIDEIQDIDPLQWRIIWAMCEAFGASLFCVGDVDQSIYEFRGAVPGYLVAHEQLFDVFRIETNYRSNPGIVDAANRLISYNQDRISKTMRANR